MQINSQSIGWNFNNSYTQLPETLFSQQLPDTVKLPSVAIFNQQLANELGLNFDNIEPNKLAQYFSGNKLFEGSQPIAQAYAGHQFGQLNMLGDGRAILLGEHLTPDNKRFDIQLKGSGQTPFSRRGDGRATLSSMLREYLISEAMHYLNIPTSRSLAVVTTGEDVYRETILPGAILTRVASSHIRVGTFEYVSYSQPVETLKMFTNYVISRHYPELLSRENSPLELLKTVMHQQINLIVNWMRVGFIHGVMNSDNMAISSETIDYGPCAFMNGYNPDTVFSSIDTGGRYAFGNQPAIVQWNMSCFAQTLLPLINPNQEKAIELAQNVINEFSDTFNNAWLAMMRKKLGLIDELSSDTDLINELLDWMIKNKADYTNTFIDLQSQSIAEKSLYNDTDFKKWYNLWQEREISYTVMVENNPLFIPRNHLVEEALKDASEENDFTKFNTLLSVSSTPYKENPSFKPYQQLPLEVDNGYKTYCGT